MSAYSRSNRWIRRRIAISPFGLRRVMPKRYGSGASGPCDDREGGIHRMAHSLEELRSLPDEELVRLHDHLAQNTSTGVSYYLTELARRDADRQGARMVDLTGEIRTLTGNIASMT